MTPKDKAVADLITAAKYAADEIDSLVSFAVRQCEFEGDEDASLGTANSLRIAAHCCKLFGSEAEALTAWNTRADSHHRLVEALTPSGDTKAAYMGEFAFSLQRVDEFGDEYSEKVYVPWDTIKEIMKAIRDRAALKETPDAQ